MKVYFVEHLTLRSWFFAVLPQYIGDKLRKVSGADQCYVFGSSVFALIVARFCAGILGLRLEQLDYRLIDVKDECGLLVGFRIFSSDLVEFNRQAIREPVFLELGEFDQSSPRLKAYIARKLVTMDYTSPNTIHGALLLIQISLWKCRQLERRDTPYIFLGRRVFMDSVIHYAQSHGAEVGSINSPIDTIPFVKRLLGPAGIALVRRWRDLWYERRLALRRALPVAGTPRLATDYQGHLNLNDAASFSDLSFWQESALSGHDIVMTFGIPQDPVDENKLAELTEHGISAVAVHPKAATLSAIPFFMHKPDIGRRFHRFSVRHAPAGCDARWIESQIEAYYVERDYWSDLFSTLNVRLYVTWYRYDGRHCAIADAMQNLGGITAIYQRGFQPDASSETTVNADIMFGYSPADAAVESLSGSVIPYHIAVGYLGDHRFSLHRSRAQQVRRSLAENGARFVVAFFDENSHNDEKLLLGHSVTRENYEFLLQKLLDNPWLGLVVKPKVPHTLLWRLGPVAELLMRAEATGRCHVFREGTFKSANPPSLAALASDLAIHGHLTAATAGLEAALAGIPTILMDREGCGNSPLYRLGHGRVVFQNWSDLWSSLSEYRKNRSDGFGDWSPLLNEFDPFRDGRAAERMGTYLQWLIEGFKAGQARETIMANAAERYVGIWGEDKITSVNIERPSLQPL